MKTLKNETPRDLKQAIALAQQGNTAFVGGGSDLLGMVKERIVTPDVLIHLKNIKGLDQIRATSSGLEIGGQVTLDTISHHPLIRSRYTVLAEAAEAVATPQIRNAGTIAGNVTQRPWCWYYRNGFPCYKAGGNQCFSITGENQFHAIFGGGPSFIVHPSDTAPALVALDSKFLLAGPKGERTVAAEDFFVLPKQNAEHENVLAPGEILVSIHVPVPRPGTKSAYRKIMDREAWTHAVVSAAVVMESGKPTIVLGGVAPIPWRLASVENLAEARPLSKNGYKIPLTKSLVERTIQELA